VTLIRLTAETPPVAADLGRRRLRGQAVPWNTDAVVSTGQRVRFLPGSVDLSGVPVVLHHDETRPIGKVIDAADNDEGQDVVASVSNTSAGDEALLLAADDVLTGFSVGVEPTEHTMEGATMVVAAATAHHLALVTRPAFASARVADVAAASGSGTVDLDDGTTVAVTVTTDPDGDATDDLPDTEPATEDASPATADDDTEAKEGPTVDTTNAAAGRVSAAPRITLAGGSLPSVGEYLHAMTNRRSDPARFAALTSIVAAAGHTTSADVTGIIPEPIYGDVISARAVDRPVLSAFGPLAGPDSGSSFRRPVITDPLLDAATAAEKSDVTDTLKVTDVIVDYSFVKRAANVSAEAIAFTSPAVLDVVAADLARAYARGTEAVAATAITAAGGVAAPILADGSDATSVLYDTAALIYAGTGVLPDTLCVAPDVWAVIGGWNADDGRSLFPVLGPSNAAGTAEGVSSFGMNVLGLRVVVSWALPVGTIRLAASPFVESYEAHRMSMRADEPSVMGVSLGIGGSAALTVLDADAVAALTISA